MEAFATTLFLLMVGCTLCHGDLPSYIKPCSKTSNLGDCIKENIEATRPHMGNGVPNLYLDPLNPWTHPSIKMNIPILRFDIYDVKVWKMDTVIVKDIDVNLDEGIFDVSLNYPYAWGECKYDIDGTLFFFNLDAKGYGNGSITDFDVTLKFRGTPKVVDGKSYIDFKKTSFAWNINGGATVFFKDIFPGNSILSESFNRVANSRAVDFYHSIQPIIEVIISDWIEKSVNGVFSNYSLDELFAA